VKDLPRVPFFRPDTALPVSPLLIFRDHARTGPLLVPNVTNPPFFGECPFDSRDTRARTALHPVSTFCSQESPRPKFPRVHCILCPQVRHLFLFSPPFFFSLLCNPWAPSGQSLRTSGVFFASRQDVRLSRSHSLCSQQGDPFESVYSRRLIGLTFSGPS